MAVLIIEVDKIRDKGLRLQVRKGGRLVVYPVGKQDELNMGRIPIEAKILEFPPEMKIGVCSWGFYARPREFSSGEENKCSFCSASLAQMMYG
jgi:hypothetical protein